MTKNFISIQDAAALSNKSVQTIRRAIKAKKLKVKKMKTPQGFNYLVETNTIYTAFNLRPREQAKKSTSPKQINKASKTVKKSAGPSQKGVTIGSEDFRSFVNTMETLLSQHNEERRSFLQLVNTLQEKIFVLENQLNLLKSPPKRKWFSFRK